MNYPDEEVNCTEPSPSVSIPWINPKTFLKRENNLIEWCHGTLTDGKGMDQYSGPPFTN